ncbi:MAG TPA: carboxypeptidase-like regulatory domain-containing protein, partial [Pyrinomonadaceae bacterium]
MKTRIFWKSSSRFASVFLLIALCTLTALAQQGLSTVRGTVKDPQGNVVAGANVKLINMATNAVRNATTSNDG